MRVRNMQMCASIYIYMHENVWFHVYVCVNMQVHVCEMDLDVLSICMRASMCGYGSVFVCVGM
jgi:hypothetical protein